MLKDIINLIKIEFSDRGNTWVVGRTSHLTHDLGLDSMDMVRLQVTIEDHYRIRFSPETTDFETVFATPESLAQHVQMQITL